jgi:hypothetical protein
MEYILLIGYTIGIYQLGVFHGVSMFVDPEPSEDEEEEYYEDEEYDIQPVKRESELPSDLMTIRFEYDEVEELFFVYEERTNKYLAHGPTTDSVEALLLERFPDKKFGINEEHAKELGML